MKIGKHGPHLVAACAGLVLGLVAGFLLARSGPRKLAGVFFRSEPQSLEGSLQSAQLIQEGAADGAVASAAPRGSERPGVSSPDPSFTFRDIARQCSPSVVFVVLKYPGGRQVSEASGFVAERGIIATNFHVIDGTVSGQVNVVGHEQKFAIRGIVAADPKRDLALLAVPDLDAPPLELGRDGDVAVGDKVFVIGNPNGLEGTFSDGLVSGKREFKDFTLLQITAPISPGSSGGPVLDARGRAVGIAKGSWEQGQNLNFAIPSGLLRSMLENRGEVQQFAKVTRPKPPKKPTGAPPDGGSPGDLFTRIWRFFRR